MGADNCPMDIGRVIRALRTEKGLKLEPVALDAGTDSGYLSRIENGVRQPSLQMLEQIAAALQTHVSSILALAEGIEGTTSPSNAMADEIDLSNEAIQLRRHFRALSPANRRLAVEILKVLGRAQVET
jgi:transcriptional regulator with XRE-family HTH domain